MRKNITALVLCFAFLLSFYCACYVKINDKKDEVSVLENVVLGNKELAKGIKIDFPSEYSNRLFWKTEYTIGGEEEMKTQFQFNKDYVYKEHIIEDYFNLYSMSISYVDFDSFLDVDQNITQGMEKSKRQQFYDDMVSEAKPYEEITKRIRIKDYMDYYPLYCEFEIDNQIHFDYYYMQYNESDEEKEKVMKWFYDYFKIPVLENEYYEVSIMVGENKQISQIGTSTVFGREGEDKYDNYNFSACCISDDEYFYLSFYNRTDKGEIIDTSEIEGGYGIYRFKKPGYNKDTGEYTLYDIENVFPIDRENEVKLLEMSEDKKWIYVLTNEKDGLYMSVISAESLELKQRMNIYPSKGYTPYFLRTKGDFIIMEIGPDAYNDLTSTYYTVITVDENGKHTQEMTVKLYDEAIGTYYYYDYSDAAWDGERLYFVTPFKDSFNGEETIEDSYCGFSVSIYSKQGIEYFGRYDLSLSTGKTNDEYAGAYYVEPDEQEKIVMTLPTEK